MQKTCKFTKSPKEYLVVAVCSLEPFILIYKVDSRALYFEVTFHITIIHLLL